jgi:hypothetical protein
LSQPSDYCTLWDEEVNHNPASKREAELFRDGPEVAAVIQNVSTRLGFNYNISYGMYVLFGPKRGEIIGKRIKLHN